MFRTLKRLWSGETNGLTAAAFIIAAAALAADVVGLLRDRTLAATFGAGNALDAYYAAFRVPDFLYNLVIVGSLSAGFIPVFAEYLENRSQRDAWKLAEQVLSVVGATLAVVCLVFAFFAPLIVPITVPGFTGEKLDLTIRLSRIMFLSPFFLGLSAVMGGVLQATRRFVAFSLAPVFYNACIIFGALVLVPRFGVEGLAWGVVLGAFLHFLIQASVAVRLGMRTIHWPSFKPEGVRRILKLMLPRTAGLAVSQLNLVILLVFASTLPAGSVAVFNFANNLQSFPVSLIGISFAVAAFPLLTRAASKKDRGAYVQSLDSAARKIAFFILPATAMFFLLRAQAVRLALGAGEFSWDDTIRTATVLGIFLISLLAQSLVPLLARAFYAYQDTWTPLWIGLISELANIGIAIALIHQYGIVGLAIAFSAATYVNLLLLFWCLEKKYGPFDKKSFLSSGIRTAIASGAIILVGWPVRQVLGTWFPLSTFWAVALQSSASGLVGGFAFILVAWLLKSPEFDEMRIAINRKLFRHGPAVAGAEEAQGV